MTTIFHPRADFQHRPFAKVEAFDGKHAARIFLDGSSYDHRIDLHLLSPADQLAWLSELIKQAQMVHAALSALTLGGAA